MPIYLAVVCDSSQDWANTNFLRTLALKQPCSIAGS